MHATPFSIDVPQPVLDDLYRRLAATAWPRDFGNDDWEYGSNLSFMKMLAGWTEMPRGGHFAAMEEPALLAQNIHAAFDRRGL